MSSGFWQTARSLFNRLNIPGEWPLTGEKPYFVPSVDRVLAVLELLARSRRGFSISEISRSLSLPKSSTYLTLSTLAHRGYLQKNPQTGKYCFGMKLVSLSRSVLENLDLREEARPRLISLMQETGLTVHLAVLERNEAVIIDRVEPSGTTKMADWIGRGLDVNCSGVGKALIAFLPENDFDHQISAKAWAKHNENTIVSIRALKRELAKVRELGYALDDEEDEIGVRCVGAPVFGKKQSVVAAISVAGTTSEIPIERVPTLAGMVKKVAADISSHLAYVGSVQPE
jgi:DNA-binding IclR family transcriptional regulator